MYGERLKNARKSRNLSQEEVALELNISRSNISKYENEELEPNLQTLKRIMQDIRDKCRLYHRASTKANDNRIKQQNNATTIININSKGE